MFHGSVRRWLVRTCIPVLVAPVLACKDVRPPDPLVGTWTLNVTRSKIHPPGLPPKSMTVTYEQTTGGLRSVSTVVLRDGSSSQSEYTAAYDGKDYPISGVPQVDSVSMRQIDPLTSECINKRGGQRVQLYTRQVYADGRVMLVTQKGSDDSAANVDRLVFEKRE
jgi:hypothetical protein